MKTRLKMLCVAALSAFTAGNAFTAPISVPNTFVAGNQAKASEVNANFTAVVGGVNTNDSRLTAIEGTVSGGNLLLGNSTAATGNILKGAVRFLHNFGTDNTFVGVGAGNFTMSGTGNTASGAAVLLSNTTGFHNTAQGQVALISNTIGSSNTAIGAETMSGNTSGGTNAAFGVQALQNNTTGSGNIALGAFAGRNLTTGNNNIHIGNIGIAGESAIIRIGVVGTQTAAFVAGVSGVAVTGAGVLVSATGQLGVAASSRRFKDEIVDMGDASSKLMKLRPVTFHYKSDRDPRGRTLQYGLVAEEVAKVAPGLVARSADGKIETVYYQFLAPMLLNEFQKQLRTIEEQKLRIEELERRTARMAELLERLDAAQGLRTASR